MKPIILGDFSKFAHLPPAERQTIFEKARYHGLDDSVYPFSIGGSDVAAIYGESPWTTALDLYYNKINKEKKNSSEENTEAKDAGHRAEDYVRNLFSLATGLQTKGNTLQAKHPIYPHCVANVDGFVVEDGKIGIYEGKTCSVDNFHAIRKWKAGIIPSYYELQVRFYMGIWDLDFAYICCGWGFRKDNIAYIKIDREKSLENQIFQDCEDFVENCQRGILPSAYSINAGLVLKSLSRIYGNADASLPPIKLSPTLQSVLDNLLLIDEQIAEVKEEKAKVEKKCKELNKQRELISSPLLEELKTATSGYLKTSNAYYDVSFNSTGRKSIDSELLKTKYPDIYNAVAKESTNRTLKLYKKER